MPLEACERSLSLLASMLAGAPVAVVPSGTTSSAFVVVPVVMSEGPAPADNEALYRVRVSFDAEVRRQGWMLPSGASLCERDLGALLAGARVEGALTAALPGLERDLARCRALLLEARPDVASLPPREGALEAWVQTRLGRKDAALAVDTKAARAWLDEALNARPSPADVASTARGLARALGASSRPLPSLWGPLPSPRAAGESVPASDDGLDGRGRRVADGRSAPLRVKTRPLIERVRRLAPSLSDNPVLHSFEKVHTLEEYQGGHRTTDEADELDAHANALEEITLGHTVRTGEASAACVTTDAALDADASGDGPTEERAHETVRYDEWDDRRRAYRREWCTVLEAPAADPVGPLEGCRWEAAIVRARRAEITRLRALFARIDSERRWRGKQLDGPDIDVDAIVDRYAALRSGHTPPAALYADRRRAAPSLSVTFLLDASSSTDAWVANRRVLDVAKEAVVVVGSALENIELGLHLAAFFSATRHACHFSTLKDFDAPWSSIGGRLQALAPEGYTRIGPAIRHATTKLAARPSKRRVLLLISDGKPTDYDAYEGHHGVADVRQALREAHAAGVESFALAVESRSRPHLAQMFGPGRYGVLTRPEALAGALGTLLARLLR
ncbi:MAG: VWA domain-containing protein [Polyangiaceae bacterium]